MIHPVRCWFFAAILSVLAIPFVPGQVAPPRALHGRLEMIDGTKTLTLWGTPWERGFAHGFLLGEVLVQDFEKELKHLLFSEEMASRYESLFHGLLLPKFQFSRREEEELLGIIQGIEARVPDKEKRTLKITGKPISTLDLKAINTAGDWMGLGCSTIAVDGSRTKDGAPAAARNFDFPAFRLLLDHQMIVVNHGRNDLKGFVGVGFPGCIGTLTAMNESGVFGTIHDVDVNPHLLEAFLPHVPRVVAMRRLMEQVEAKGAVSQAHQLLKTWPTLYGNNIFIATPQSSAHAPFAGVLEYDHRHRLHGGATLRKPDRTEAGYAPLLVCTNHHRLRPDSGRLPALENCERYEALTQSFGKGQGQLDAEQLFAIAMRAARPSNQAPLQYYRHGTLHQAVALLGEKEFHVRLATVGRHISQEPVTVFDLDELLDPSKRRAEAGSPAGSGR
jgi:hypothetical protein